MTRIELYKEYREEIAKSSRLGKSIVDSDESVIHYTKAINKLNPTILRSIKDTTMKLEGGIMNVDIKNQQMPEEVTELFNTLNNAACNEKVDEINAFFHSKIDHSIVKGNEFDKQWVESNKDYSKLVSINTSLGNNFVEEKEFVTDLTDKYKYMSQSSGIEEIKKLTTIEKPKHKDGLRKAIIIVGVITIIFIAALLVLNILKGVKG